MFAKYIYILCLVTAFFALFSRCASPNKKEVDEANSLLASTQRSASFTTVQTAMVKRKPFIYRISVGGKIRSQNRQVVAAETSGRLLTFHALPGAIFTTGALIAQMDITLLELRMERNKLNLYNAEKEYDSQLLGYQSLLENMDAEQAAIIKKKLKISSGLAGAEQDLKETTYELAKCAIRAPYTCRVADIKVQSGDMIRGGQEMFTLYDPFNLILETKVLETDVDLIKKGTPALLTTIANGEKKYKATVQNINPHVDDNGMVLIELKIAGAENFFPGMNCTAEISIQMQKTLIVPKDAVVTRSTRQVVFTIKNSLAKWHYVTVGRDNGREIEIKDGLQEGEHVIITNNLQLAQDAPVKTAN